MRPRTPSFRTRATDVTTSRNACVSITAIPYIPSVVQTANRKVRAVGTAGLIAAAAGTVLFRACRSPSAKVGGIANEEWRGMNDVADGDENE
jgi:hypothetical protein